ncbi:hypothetical protein LY474_12250 [Myxococcus stipitatus]|uniref:hypothetical protein n=1 Tax=Myxococcus stipitatus TaxID=83455 RepID=UPI001F40EDFF|nr:hypothetical protein [Myxococcus stipitatus]MCE9668585.1 hypothetical protein [Myxococcus stipitatus]
MRPQHSSPERRVDGDGVTQVSPARSGGAAARWLVGGALAFLLLAVGASYWLSSDEVGTPAWEETPVVVTPPPVAQPAPAVARAPTPPVPQRAPLAQPQVVVGGAADAPASSREADMPDSEPTGLQLYKPGTKPLKRGIVVPEDFELPPGYVRHYQSTDQGERVEAILMFHPDHQPKDANGQPIPIPDNRVVPAELAPPGLPIRLLELPRTDGDQDAP